jgi:O-antigen ligase
MGSVVLTYIRIAWIALFAAVAIILAKRSRILLVVLVIAVLVMIVAVPSLRTRIGSVIGQGRQLTMEQDPSTRFRSQAWGLALDLFRQQPVRGTGMGSYFPASAKIFPKATSPHNEYLRVLAETGVVGLALFVWALFSWVWFSVRTLRSLTDPFFRSLALSALGASAAFIVLCITDNPLVYHSVNMYFWALLALVDAGRRIQDSELASFERASASGADHG